MFHSIKLSLLCAILFFIIGCNETSEESYSELEDSYESIITEQEPILQVPIDNIESKVEAIIERDS
jgi:hypothetical protein